MAENGNVHPGSFVGDSVEEFRKLPPWGKALAGVALLFAAYLGYSAYRSGQTGAGTAGAGAGGQAGAGQQGAMIGGVPQIPTGFSPQYNPTTGALEGYQPTPTGGGATPPPSGTGGTTTPPPGGGLQGGNPPTGGQVGGGYIPLWQQLHVPGPLIPSGQYKGPSFSNLKPGTMYNYGGVNYKLTTSVAGEPGSGLLYGINPQGQTVALYGPPSAYHTVASPAVVQPGGQNGATQVPTTRVG